MNSPYAVAKKLNDLFQAFGIDRTVPPQMMYNYAKNGLIDGTKRSSLKDVKFSDETVQAFLTKYMLKNYKIDISVTQQDETVEENNEEVEGQLNLIDSLIESNNEKLIMSQLPGAE